MTISQRFELENRLERLIAWQINFHDICSKLYIIVIRI